ncbi:hypothetical protein ACWFRB_12105 [Rhodococcus sp. NPDC055112]
MNRKMLVAAGAMAIGIGAVLAPSASAQAPGEHAPCSQMFRVPIAPDAWNTTNRVVFSPFGTDNIYCTGVHGLIGGYQLDPRGNRHRLNAPFAGPFTGHVYFWDPATF